MSGNSWGRGLAGAALLAVLAASGAAAQQTPRAPGAPRTPRAPEAARECRCVDADGREMDRCVCFVTPDVDVRAFPGMAFSFAGRRAVLGVNVRQDQPAEDDERGARLFGVDEDSPAGRAGLEEGDIVVEVDGRSLLTGLPEVRDEERLDEDRSIPVQRLLALLADKEPGDEVTIAYLRGGERRTATIEMEEPRSLVRFAPEGRAMSFGPEGMTGMRGPAIAFGPDGMEGTRAFTFRTSEDCPSREGTDARRGFAFGDLGRSCVAGVELLQMNAGLAEYFGAVDGGVLVADAEADNPLGLRAGDVLLAVGGRTVRGVDQALRVLGSYEAGEQVDLRVRRRDQSLEVQGRVR